MSDHTVLAIEASSDTCSVALTDGSWDTTRSVLAPREHTQIVLEQMHELLGESGAPVPTVVAYGRGPGSFTGVRIAAAVAEGFALAHDVPIAGISSLAALAHAAGGTVVPALDARLGQIYWGAYGADGTAHIADRIDTVEDFCAALAERTDDWQGVGSAWHIEVVQQAAGDHAADAGAQPQARAVAALALAELAAGLAPDAARAQPCYLRGPEIQ